MILSWKHLYVLTLHGVQWNSNAVGIFLLIEHIELKSIPVELISVIVQGIAVLSLLTRFWHYYYSRTK